jgi:hypothetical protein
MEANEDEEYSGPELLLFNIICNHQQVVFESDMVGADGSHIDDRSLK